MQHEDRGGAQQTERCVSAIASFHRAILTPRVAYRGAYAFHWISCNYAAVTESAAYT